MRRVDIVTIAVVDLVLILLGFAIGHSNGVDKEHQKWFVKGYTKARVDCRSLI